MSTKTTIKRIALVAVSALAMGMMTTGVAKAANGTGTYTTNITLSTSSLTVVSTETPAYGFFSITTSDNAGNNNELRSGETIRLSVVSNPTSVDTTTLKTDVLFQAVSRTATGSSAKGTWASSLSRNTAPGTGTDASPWVIGTTNSVSPTDAANATNYAGTYWVGVYTNQTRALNAGAYTIRVRLTNANGVVEKNISVSFVRTAADSGAVLTAATTGGLRVGTPLTYGQYSNASVTLRNASGGLIQTGVDTVTSGPGIPTVATELWSGSTAAVNLATSKLTASDTGTQGFDFYSTTASDCNSFSFVR